MSAFPPGRCKHNSNVLCPEHCSGPDECCRYTFPRDKSHTQTPPLIVVNPVTPPNGLERAARGSLPANRKLVTDAKNIIRMLSEGERKQLFTWIVECYDRPRPQDVDILVSQCKLCTESAVPSYLYCSVCMAAIADEESGC